MHQAEHYLPRLEVGCNPVDNSLGVIRHSGHNQMTDDDTFRHDTVIVNMVVAYLIIHFLNSFGCDAEVVGCVAVFDSSHIVAVF